MLSVAKQQEMLSKAFMQMHTKIDLHTTFFWKSLLAWLIIWALYKFVIVYEQP